MARKNTPDLILLGICLALVFVGILILASVSSSFSLQRTGSTFFFLNHQLLYGLLPGLVFGTISFFLPLELFRRLSFIFLIGNMILLGLVFLPGIGESVSGAHRWIFLGSLSFQPSELLKVTFILYVASWLAARAPLVRQPRAAKRSARSTKPVNLAKNRSVSPELTATLAPFVAIMGVISFFLILQPDISTLGVIGITALMMYFLAGTPMWHTFAMLGVGLVGLGLVILMAPYRVSRLSVFLNPSLDPLGQGYQLKQALIGIGSGGLFGTGLGLSFQKFGVLPEPISDSIFAVFAEEVGFLGSFLLLLLFCAFAWRSFVIAKRAPDQFSYLVACGIAFWLVFQSSINIGSMLGLLPLTGIPLPFISYGGSALMSELIAVGILLNISKQT